MIPVLETVALLVLTTINCNVGAAMMLFSAFEKLFLKDRSKMAQKQTKPFPSPEVIICGVGY